MQAVLTHAMPPGNLTEITPEERQVLAAWIADGAAKARVPAMTTRRAVRGRLLTLRRRPGRGRRRRQPSLPRRWRWSSIEAGSITAVGDAAELLPTLPPGTPVDHYPGPARPAGPDRHPHPLPADPGDRAPTAPSCSTGCRNTPSSRSRSSPTPPTRTRVARFFLDELLRNGTTTAVVYCTVRPESAEAFFAESQRRNARMIAGKVMMDRGAPEGLLDTPQRGYAESKALIGRWHGQGRQLYAITPRFALTSTEGQLEAAGALLREHPDCYLQTHLAENHDEIATARRLYPTARELHRHLRPLRPARAALAVRPLHPSRPSRARAALGDAVGRGLLPDLQPVHRQRPVRPRDAARSGDGRCGQPRHRRRRRHQLLDAAHGGRGLQGAAAAAPEPAGARRVLPDDPGQCAGLSLEQRDRRPRARAEADLVVLDARATPAMAHRMETIEGDLAEELFVLMTMGDDRAVRATYVAGERLHAA